MKQRINFVRDSSPLALRKSILEKKLPKVELEPESKDKKK